MLGMDIKFLLCFIYVTYTFPYDNHLHSPFQWMIWKLLYRMLTKVSSFAVNKLNERQKTLWLKWFRFCHYRRQTHVCTFGILSMLTYIQAQTNDYYSIIIWHTHHCYILSTCQYNHNLILLRYKLMTITN